MRLRDQLKSNKLTVAELLAQKKKDRADLMFACAVAIKRARLIKLPLLTNRAERLIDEVAKLDNPYKDLTF